MHTACGDLLGVLTQQSRPLLKSLGCFRVGLDWGRSYKMSEISEEFSDALLVLLEKRHGYLRSISRNMPTSTARSVRFSSQSISNSAKERLCG